MIDLSVEYYFRQLDLCWFDKWLENPRHPTWWAGGYYQALIRLREIAKPYEYEEHNPFLWDEYAKREEAFRERLSSHHEQAGGSAQAVPGGA